MSSRTNSVWNPVAIKLGSGKYSLKIASIWGKSSLRLNLAYPVNAHDRYM